MVKSKKIKESTYTDGNESFEITFDGETVIVTANTDFKYLGLKEGQSNRINKDYMESSINEELFDFEND